SVNSLLIDRNVAPLKKVNKRSQVEVKLKCNWSRRLEVKKFCRKICVWSLRVAHGALARRAVSSSATKFLLPVARRAGDMARRAVQVRNTRIFLCESRVAQDGLALWRGAP
ncbi:hypothetical protein A2U01_0040518, partial [Trifolium medium]|nr:hypothetical protein [Trifolium medium]